MSKLTSYINKAKRVVRDIEKAQATDSNQLFVCKEYTKPLNGALVIILYTETE